MRILNKMKKTMLVLAASLFCANVAFAGEVALTADMFKTWDSPTEPTTSSTAYGACVLNESTDLPYGDINVGYLNYADLSEYSKLVVTVSEGTPRFCFNRLTADGQDTQDGVDSKMIDIPGKPWAGPKYQTVEGNVYTIDLEKIVADYGYARLNCIKGANWAKVTVTSMMLVEKEPAGEIVVDADFEDGYIPFFAWHSNTRTVKDGVLEIAIPAANNAGDQQMAYDNSFEYKATYTMKFKVKGSAAGYINAHFQVTTDGYKDAGNFGKIEFGTDWTEFESSVEVNSKGADRLIFNLGSFEGTVYMDDFELTVVHPNPEDIEPVFWVSTIANGDFEGTETASFVAKENGGANAGAFVAPAFTDAIGKDGSRGIKVTSYAGATNDWDAQFWIAASKALPAGTEYRVTFDYRASAAVNVGTQAHGAPGSYLHNNAIGNVSFTTEWQHFEKSGFVSAEYQSIAFNLSADKANGVDFFLDNITFEYAVSAEEYAILQAVDTLNILIAEVEAYQKTLDLTDPMQVSMNESLTTAIADAKAAAEAKESLEAVTTAQGFLNSVYVSVVGGIAGPVIGAAEELMASYENPTDEAGLGAAIQKVYEIYSALGTGMGSTYTVADLAAAVEAVKVAQEAFVAENAKSDMAVVKSWDFAAMADTMSVSDMYMTYSDETVNVGGTASNLGTGVWEGLAMQGANKFFIRTKTGGLYQGNGGGRKVGILDLVPGQKVTIVTDSECFTLNSTDITEQTSVETVDGKTTYVYTMTGEGTLALTMTRYLNIFSITVEQKAAMLQTALWDFAAMADTMTVSDMYMTYSDETVKVGGTASNLGTGFWEGLAMQGANKFWVRSATGGLYSGNGGGRKVGILDLKKASVVTIVTNGECMTLADATVAEQTSMETVDGKTTYVYTMVEDGTLALTMTRYFSIFSIKVEALVKYVSAPNWNFAAYCDTMTVSDAYMTYSDETVKVGGTASNLGTGFWEGLAMQGANKFWVRSATGGLYSGNGGGRKVGVLNMTAGSIVTIVTNGECMSLADATVAEQTSMETVDGKTTYVYTMTADGTLALTMTRYYSIFSINVLAVQADIKAPTIETVGNYYDFVTVSMACETKDASIYYSINGGEELLYEEPIVVDTVSLITAYSTNGKVVSKLVEKEVIAGAVDVPTATVTSVQGTTRVVELACALEGTRLYYTTDTTAVDYKMYIAPIYVSDTTDVWAYSVYTNPDRVKFTSVMMKEKIAAGTSVALNAPTFAKAVVDSLTQVEYTEKNLSAYMINNDQSSVLCAPTAKITYEFYPLNTETGRIAALPSLSGEYVAGDTLFALPLGKLVAKASAAGYAPAEAYIWLKAPAQLTPVWEVDFTSIATAQWLANDSADLIVDATYRDFVFNGKFRANMSADFKTASFGDSVLNNNFVLHDGQDWELRYRQGVIGLFNNQSGDRGFGFANLKKNQVVKVSYEDASQAIFMDGVIEQDLVNSNGNDICYNVTADGNATIAMNRYFYISKVGVYISSALTQIPDFAITKVDGNTHYVGMTSGTKGADIYYAIGNEEYAEVQVLVNDTTGGVAPVYETKIDTTVVYGDEMLYTEPVALAESAYVRAYAMYQDVESEAREQFIEAGVAVQIAQPVIVYVGENVAGQKQFTISVDNSNVVSAPETPIYYTLPGGKETLYNGGTISVSDDVYGWMTAVAKLAGYEDSKVARRYIDARESYTEKYEVVDAALETVPAEAGDIEIDYSEDMNVEQLGATAFAGRVYFHRVVEANTINVSLPTVFNNNSYVTDAAGNKLERGVDYVIFEILANENPIQDVLSGNMAATAAKGYVVNFLNADLIGEEVIFVSAEKGNIAKGNFTYAQPEAGYKVVTNRTFAAATLDVPAYVLNAEGTAFDLVETGAVVAPFQSVILASADICATVSSLSALSTGIESIAADKDVKEIKYFTVGGVEVEKPAAGVYIQQIIFTDGTVKSISVAGK